MYNIKPSLNQGLSRCRVFVHFATKTKQILKMKYHGMKLLIP